MVLAFGSTGGCPNHGSAAPALSPKVRSAADLNLIGAAAHGSCASQHRQGTMGYVTTTSAVPALVSLGYEGRSAQELVDQLVRNQVTTLVDVRLTPLSRKPGLSKQKLSAALSAVGIDYVHLRHLGNPKDNRDGFRSGDGASRARFHDVLRSPDGLAALRHVVDLIDGGTVALLCFERDHQICHRDVVLSEVRESRPHTQVVHL